MPTNELYAYFIIICYAQQLKTLWAQANVSVHLI